MTIRKEISPWRNRAAIDPNITDYQGHRWTLGRSVVAMLIDSASSIDSASAPNNVSLLLKLI